MNPTLRHLFSIIIFLFSVATFAQTDTTSLFPETIFECDADPNGIYSNTKILGSLDEQRVLLSVYNVKDKTTELWLSGGTKESTRLVNRAEGRIFFDFRGKLRDQYVLMYWSDIWLLDLEKNSLEVLKVQVDPAKKCSLHEFQLVNNFIFFPFERRMFCTDGTPEGTFEFADAITGSKAEFYGNFPETFWTTQERFMFLSKDNDIWVSDGTKQGTYILNYPELRPLEDAKASLHRVLFYTEDYEICSTDGTVEGTYVLPGCANRIDPMSFGLKEMIFYNDELYWTDIETSSIYKFDNQLRSEVAVCEKDSISLGGGFDVLNDQLYWCSDVDHYSAYGIKINLGNCERTDDPDRKAMTGKDFYMVEDGDSLFVYANIPGKMKTPLPYLVKKSNAGSGIEFTHGNVCYTSPVGEDAFIVRTMEPNRMWMVQPHKNAFRPLKWKPDEAKFGTATHQVCGSFVYFMHSNQNKEFISVLKL